MLIDTHAHLFDGRLAGELPAVLARAAAAGVGRVVCIGLDRDTNRQAVRLANTYPAVSAAVGIHPNSVAEAEPGDWDEVVRLAEAEPKVVAIGETGLDRYWDKAPFSLQEEFFARHVELARRVGKPFVVHAREAEPDVVRVLRPVFDRHGPLSGVMHSYCGDLPTARACLEMGLYVSFAGMLTYPNAQNLREVAAEIPADRLLVETDCPYLTPVPHRGKRNEPAFVAHTAAVLAGVRRVSAEALAEQTTRNAMALFGLGVPDPTP